MNTIGLEVREEGHELSDQNLDTVNGGGVWFIPIVFLAAVAGYAYGATHPIK